MIFFGISRLVLINCIYVHIVELRSRSGEGQVKVRFRSGSGKVQLRNITAPFSQLPDPRSHINFKPQTHHSLFIADSFPIKLKPQTHKVTPFTRQLPHNLQASNTPAAHELKEGFKKSREFSLTGKSKMPIFLKPSLMNYTPPLLKTQNMSHVYLSLTLMQVKFV